jgi:hypothetical protein
LGNNGINTITWNEDEIARKFQIKELFWENNNYSETCKYRDRIWNTLDQAKANIEYAYKKEK